jgi:hypothetical protein
MNRSCYGILGVVLDEAGFHAAGAWDDGAATPVDTVVEMLASTRRSHVRIRSSFLHQGQGLHALAGPLAELVKAGDRRGLLGYLLAHAATNSARPTASWCAYPPGVWVRALRLGADSRSPIARAAVSKVWARLERHQLIRRERIGRTTAVVLLREDGSGRDYTVPWDTGDERFFKLPYNFWLESYDQKLSLPALAMLLIACDLKPNFRLPYERVPDWYGISGDTAKRGFGQLIEAGILVRHFRRKKAPLSDVGWAPDFHYQLTGPFTKDLKHNGQSGEMKSDAL